MTIDNVRNAAEFLCGLFILLNGAYYGAGYHSYGAVSFYGYTASGKFVCHEQFYYR